MMMMMMMMVVVVTTMIYELSERLQILAYNCIGKYNNTVILLADVMLRKEKKCLSFFHQLSQNLPRTMPLTIALTRLKFQTLIIRKNINGLFSAQTCSPGL
jgi:hypothetical protein